MIYDVYLSVLSSFSESKNIDNIFTGLVECNLNFCVCYLDIARMQLVCGMLYLALKWRSGHGVAFMYAMRH